MIQVAAHGSDGQSPAEQQLSPCFLLHLPTMEYHLVLVVLIALEEVCIN